MPDSRVMFLSYQHRCQFIIYAKTFIFICCKFPNRSLTYFIENGQGNVARETRPNNNYRKIKYAVPVKHSEKFFTRILSKGIKLVALTFDKEVMN